MNPIRIQRKRTKGWRMPPNTIYVGRPSKWGNPFKVGELYKNTAGWVGLFGILPAKELYKIQDSGVLITRELSIDMYTRLMGLRINPDSTERDYWIKNLKLLKDKTLCCWCKENEPCHADILLKLANDL